MPHAGQPRRHHRRADEGAARPGLPHWRHNHGQEGHPRRVRDGPRLADRAREVQGGRGQERPQLHRGHRDPLPGEPPAPAGKAGRAGAREEAARDQQHPRRRRPPRHRHHHRPQEGRHPAGGAEQAVQAHAAAGGLRRDHAVAGGRRAARAFAEGDAALLHRAPGRGHRPPYALRAGEGRGARAYPRRLDHRAGQHRRGHPHHPLVADRQGSGRAHDRALRPDRQADRRHPRNAPAPPDRLGASEDRGRVEGAVGEDRVLQARPVRRPAGARHHQRGAVRGQEEVRQPPSHALVRGGQGPRCRGSHRRGEHGRHDDEGRLREAPARGHLPPAEARRQGHVGREPQGQRLRRAPVRGVDALLHAVLLHEGQGVPPEGVRAARGVAPCARHGHREPAAA